MSKYRSKTHDAPKQPAIDKPSDKPLPLPPSRIPIINHRGDEVGHVGKLAHQGAVSRFGVKSAKIGKHQGRVAWVEPKPKPVRVDVPHASAAKAKLFAQRNQAKGSVSKTLAEVSAEGATTFSGGGKA